MKPKYFKTQAKFRKWLEDNHESKDEIWVGYYKKATKIPSITWPESVDEGLCFGWIDGIRKKVDEKSYKIRFTPRRKKSHWSRVNIKRIDELIKLGLVHKSGLEAFEKLDPSNAELASYEQEMIVLEDKYLDVLRANKDAWAYYQGLSPYATRASNWYIMSAKRESTRETRLKILVDCCKQKLKIPQLRSSGK